MPVNEKIIKIGRHEFTLDDISNCRANTAQVMKGELLRLIQPVGKNIPRGILAGRKFIVDSLHNAIINTLDSVSRKNSEFKFDDCDFALQNLHDPTLQKGAYQALLKLLILPDILISQFVKHNFTNKKDLIIFSAVFNDYMEELSDAALSNQDFLNFIKDHGHDSRKEFLQELYAFKLKGNNEPILEPSTFFSFDEDNDLLHAQMEQKIYDLKRTTPPVKLPPIKEPNKSSFFNFKDKTKDQPTFDDIKPQDKLPPIRKK